MKKYLLLFALFFAPAAGAQQLVNCIALSNTPCVTSSNPGAGTQGDPAWLAFGKINQDFLGLGSGSFPPGPPYCVFTNDTGSSAAPLCGNTINIQSIIVGSGGSIATSGTGTNQATTVTGASSLSGVNADGQSTLSLTGVQAATGNLAVGLLENQTFRPNGPINVNGAQFNFHLGNANGQNIANLEGLFISGITIDSDYSGTAPAVASVEVFNVFDNNSPTALTSPVTFAVGYLCDSLPNGNGAQTGSIANRCVLMNNNSAFATGNGATFANNGVELQVPLNTAFDGPAPTNAALTISGNGGQQIISIAIVDIGSVATPNTGGGDGTKFIVNWQSTSQVPKTFPLKVGQVITIAGETPAGYNGACTVQATPAPQVVIVSTIRTSQFTCLGATTGAQTVAGTLALAAGSPVPVDKAVNITSTLSNLIAGPIQTNGLFTGTAGANINGGTVTFNNNSNNVFNANTGTSTGAVHLGDGTGNNAANIGNGTGKVEIGGPLISVTNNSNQFTVAGTGGCSAPVSLNGGVQAGDFTCSSTAAATATITMKNTVTAYSCWARNITTAANLVVQTGVKAVATATLTFTTGTNADVIQFGCLGY